MGMHDANDHNGMYECTWQMDANGTFTDACWVWRMYIISIQRSNQHCRSGNARIHWISLHYKYAQMLLMVGWFSCIFSESTQRVTHTIPGTLHSWIHARHNTTHLPVASRVDCCLFAVTCRASSTSATHVGIDSIDVLVSVHWLRFPIQFHRINPPRLRGEARAMTAMMSAMCRLTRSNP